ncbi:hypothetical protein [Mucilaginibacter sp.]|uniref:hypothetical protein n=1 Tax=Mucilaginibacter sp. TaxID=1882438 RepID=UPI0025EDE0E8|nr:hypothetical protein [Mucilaginibacter sp.]
MIKINFKNGGGIDVTEEITSKMTEKYSSFNKDEIFVEGITVDFDEKELTR